jgi:replicative DNA helicase
MNIGHLEVTWLKAIIQSPNYLDVGRVEFFSEASSKELFKIVKSFWAKYHQIPSCEQVKEISKMLSVGDRLSIEQIQGIYDTDLSKYDEEWLTSNTQAWIEWKNLELSAVESISYIKTTQVTPENIQDVITTFKTIINDRNNLDFTFQKGSDFFNPQHHIQSENSTFSSGYSFFDFVLGGGWSSKSLNVLLGQPNVGKSLWLGNLAAQAFRNGHNVAVITLEMIEAKYMKRVGSNILGVKMSDYKDFANNPERIKKRLGSLVFDNLKVPGQIHIREFPTSNASVLDVEKWLRKMEEILGIKFKIVLIDYINILKNWRNPNTENTYMKIKQIAEDLRGMAMTNDWCVITATQTKQGDFDASDLSMSSASESSALAATVDSMFGIIQDPLMYSNHQYKIKVLKNRDEGYKNSYRLFNVDYSYMRITEDPDSEIITEG